MYEDEQKEEAILEVINTTPVVNLGRDLVNIIIPECCREGWETCPHVAKRERPRRGNIGL